MKKLLICTQAVDRNDPTLGFFHTWIAKLAEEYEQVTVFALRVGDYSLPKNVTVVSLGKTRVARAWNLLNYSFALRHDYDAVFVHMSQEFVLFTGWLWRRLGKPIYLWRNHYAGSVATDRAARQCKKVFCTSKSSYTAQYSNTVLMPVGVDTEHFTRLPQVLRDPRSVLFLGRLTPAKRPHLLLEALHILQKRGVTFDALFCGAQAPQDRLYIQKLENMIKEFGLSRSVRVQPGVPLAQTPELFNHYAMFVNCSPSGMYDKTLFEAASCECAVVASSKDFAELVPARFIFEDGNAEDLANKLGDLLKLSLLDQQGIGSQMRNSARQHSLSALMSKLHAEMQ